MKTPLRSPDEARRLEALRHYNVLDTPPERALDDLTALAAHICDVPVALISLIDERRLWFKSKVGLFFSETSRDASFCGQAILQPDMFIVPDAAEDERFADNSLVVGDPHARFYAGMPLLTQAGQPIGTMCVLDRVPRELTPSQQEALRVLSRQVMSQLELLRHTRDLIERERVLRISEARYRALFEYAPDGILVADHDSYYIDANASACRMLGYARDELIGQHIADIVAQSEIPHIGPALRVIKENADHHREWQFQRKDGSVFRAEVIGAPMPDGNMLSIIRDLTQRTRTETRFRRLVDSNAQGVYFWNAQGEMTGANDAFLRIIDYTREHLEAGRISRAAITPREHADADRHALEELAAKGVCAPFETEYIRRDGSRVPVLVGAAAFDDAPGEGVCFVLDLTERKKLERQSLRAQRMESIGTLAGGIAHGLNNVLAPILASVEILKDLARNEDDLAVLATLQASVERGAELVRQVLSFGQGVEGQRITVNPISIMGDLLKVMRDSFPKSIGVHFVHARDLWTITGDPTQMHQVLLNLCVNARDAMPGGGDITVSMENVVMDEAYAAMHPGSRAGAYVLMKVEDTGSGITPEMRDRIFEPFFTTKDIGKGTGLGLSTVLAIVSSHGGFITLSSQVGHGTTFNAYLPANTAETAAAGNAAADGSSLLHGNGELVLVVDDEEALRKIAQRMLERFGYRVMLACHGADAVSLYARHQRDIAVVLTDMAMPIMDGPALIIALRAMNPQVRIIGSSGLIVHDAAARAAGLQQFVPKPYTAETMLRALQQVLRGHYDVT
jgi:two-component system cell cycle sensor histidine kinase/response regulator CckA